MPTAEKDAAASDQALALTNSLSIKATPIEARIIELKMKPRSNEIIPWIGRLRANGANPTSNSDCPAALTPVSTIKSPHAASAGTRPSATAGACTAGDAGNDRATTHTPLQRRVPVPPCRCLRVDTP